MQLRNNNTLCTIDNKSTIIRHVWNGTQEHVLDKGTKIFMIGICTIKFHLRLQGHTIGQSTLQTFFNGISRRIDKVIQELENEIITRIGDREVLGEHLIQTVILAFLRWGFQL